MTPPVDRLDPVVLWARAVALAAVSVFLGVAGHATADGLLPGPATIGLVLAVACVVSAALLARPASTVRVVSLLVAGQAAVHVVLSATAGHVGEEAGRAPRLAPAPSGALPTVDGRRVGSLHEAWDTGTATAARPALPADHLVSDLVEHAPMMLAHLAAAALVGLWLAAGERCLWALLALLAGPAVRLLLLAWAVSGSGVPGVPGTAPTAATLLSPRRLADLDRCVVRRGPPLLLCS